MNTDPRRIGKYELRERLGGGGMSEVWKAFDPQLQRYVAIKLLHVDLQNDPEFMNRFTREARIIASLHHPNIVQLHDFQISPESPNGTIAYMVMDYIEGPTLATYIASTSGVRKYPSAGEIVHLFTSISRGIDYAHQKGVSHRNIKPANILLDKGNIAHNPMGEPILTDFGIAQLLGTSTGGHKGPYGGAALYIAPEQVQGYPGNERSDIYALGVILYEICTGLPPFRDGKPTDIMQQHVNAMPTAPALINPNIHPVLAEVLMRGLAKDPAARFPSASAIAAALTQAFNLPVPTDLNLPAYATDEMSEPTYYRPLRGNISPSSPSLPIIKTSSPPPVTISTPSSAASASGEESTLLMPGGEQSTILMADSIPTLIRPVQTSAGTTPAVLSSSPPPDTHKGYPYKPGRRRRGLFVALIALLILVLIGSGLAAFYGLTHNTPPVVMTNPIIGQAFFASSGQLVGGSTQRINDELGISLHNISAPAPGKSYYAWLLGDKSQEAGNLGTPILLGTLHPNHGNVQFLYSNPQHTDLLAITSRFLITEESANITPTSPSADQRTWRYYAELPQTPDPTDTAHHFSMLDHVRFLLSEYPTIKDAGLSGGLTTWFVKNTGKVLEWAGSARDYWDSKSPTLMHDQLIRILDYLDGAASVQADVPSGTPIIVDKRPISIALLGLGQTSTDTSSYLRITGGQLTAIAQAPGATSKQRELVNKINLAINNVTQWLMNVHQDAKQLVQMTDAQLLLPSTLPILDDMQTQAFYAYVGQLDPSTNKVREGVIQIQDDITRLATLDITPYGSQK